MNFKLNEAEYRTVLEAVVSANDYIVVADADRRIRALNRTPFGLELDHFIGRDFVELAAHDQRGLVREAAERVGAGAPPVELEVKGAETDRWYSMRIVGNEDHGCVVGFAISLHDIDETKRRQAERANLRAQLRNESSGGHDGTDTVQHRLELLADALPVLVAYVDADCRFQYNNAMYERWFAVSREDIKGQRMEEVLGKEAYATIRAMVETALAGEEVSFETELRYKNVGRRQVISHYVPNLDANGSVRGFFALIEDVTNEREVQAALRKRQDELRQLQKMEALGGFASSIAHEFNNLLQVVINGCNVVLLSSPEDSQVSRQIGRVVKAAQRGVSLTRRLLTFSRENQVQMEDLDLDSLLDDMGILLAFLLGSKVALKVDLQSRCRIRGDAGLLQQVLMNLVINARDAMPEGGRRVGLHHVLHDHPGAREGDMRGGHHADFRLVREGDEPACDRRHRVAELQLIRVTERGDAQPLRRHGEDREVMEGGVVGDHARRPSLAGRERDLHLGSPFDHVKIRDHDPGRHHDPRAEVLPLEHAPLDRLGGQLGEHGDDGGEHAGDRAAHPCGGIWAGLRGRRDGGRCGRCGRVVEGCDRQAARDPAADGGAEQQRDEHEQLDGCESLDDDVSPPAAAAGSPAEGAEAV